MCDFIRDAASAQTEQLEKERAASAGASAAAASDEEEDGGDEAEVGGDDSVASNRVRRKRQQIARLVRALARTRGHDTMRLDFSATLSRKTLASPSHASKCCRYLQTHRHPAVRRAIARRGLRSSWRARVTGRRRSTGRWGGPLPVGRGAAAAARAVHGLRQPALLQLALRPRGAQRVRRGVQEDRGEEHASSIVLASGDSLVITAESPVITSYLLGFPGN
jgi:hypothetical protein